MRHLFFVHSSITRHLADAIVKHERLDPAAVFYLLDRGMELPEAAGRTLDVRDWTWRNLAGTAHNWRQLRRLDEFLAQAVGGAFRFYPPHHITATLRAVLSHPLARSFAYAEEGIGSYSSPAQLAAAFPPAQLSWPARVAQRIKFRGRIAPRSVFFYPEDARYRGAYALHPAAFPSLPQVRVLPLPFPPAPGWAQVRHVWAPSPLAEFRVCDRTTQLRLTEGLIRYWLDHQTATVHVKYHPRQLQSDGMAPVFRALFGRFADRLNIIELPPQISLESLALSSRATFYTGTSSAGFYALLCGCAVKSYARDLTALVPAFQQTLNRMPGHFIQHVDHLQLELP